MIKAALTSIAAYVPQKILSNFDLEKMVDTSDDWIVKRTGIRTRHIAAENEGVVQMACNAANLAISRANIEKNQIDAIICATLTPDYLCMPSTATQVAHMIGLNNIMAFDISAACTGFIYLIDVAKSLIQSGSKKNILIIGTEKISSILDYTDRTTCVLFGDGAGAAIISATDKENFIISTHCSSDGSKGNLLFTPRNGENSFVQMSGNEVFKVAVNTLTNDVVELLETVKIDPKDIDLFIPHQANLRIISAVQQRLGLSDEQCVISVDEYGNTSSASIPMAMNKAFEDGRLKNGSLVLLDAFGGGFTWGSAVLRFGI